MLSKKPLSKKAFTLIELVAVIAIVGVLVVGVLVFSKGIINSVKDFKNKFPSYSNIAAQEEDIIPGKPDSAPAFTGTIYQLRSLANGVNVYTNRTYTITNLDSRFEGAYFYSTENEVYQNPTMTFTVPTTLYVIVNNNLANSGFEPFSDYNILDTTDIPFDIGNQFYKVFQPGEYQLFDPSELPFKALYIVN